MTDDRSTTIVLLGVLLVGALIAGQLVAASPDMVVAVLAGSVAAILSLALISRLKDDQQFLIRLWLLALGLRVVVASLIYYFGLQDILAPDWATYDALGDHLAQLWSGTRTGGTWFIGDQARYRSGWGMYYYVAAVYTITGRNPFALQLLSGILGANTCVLIYRIARMIYPSHRLARLAGILTAIAPSLLIWTSQGLKEPLICFLLSVSLLYTMKLRERVTVKDVFWLLLSLFSLYALRYYVFFVVFVAVAGALIFAAKEFSPKQILQGSGAVLLIGLIFAYYGAGSVAQSSMNLSQMQANREWSASASDSGYGGNVDITDTRQAIVYLPLLTVIFLFAPFPWMIRNINHLVTLPEMILWWLSAPFMLRGFWLALRHRLKAALPLCIFTAGLTLAYALYLTNFGTAHRMRVQLLGFLIIFVGIGWEAFRITRKRKRAGAGSRNGTMGRLTPVHTGARSEAYVRNRWSGN